MIFLQASAGGSILDKLQYGIVAIVILAIILMVIAVIRKRISVARKEGSDGSGGRRKMRFPKKLFFTLVTVGSVFFVYNYIFSARKRAIKIVQNASGQSQNLFTALFQLNNGGKDYTWKDFADKIANEKVNETFKWNAEETEEDDIYLVAFTNENLSGYRWEVNLEHETVIFVNQNEYRSRKYGLSRLDRDYNYKVEDLKVDTFKIENSRSGWLGKRSTGIVYQIEGSVLNNTDKVITEGKLEGNLKVIFKDKTVTSGDEYSSGFRKSLSNENPWLPGTKRKFKIKTSQVELVYLDYTPEYVIMELELTAEDPIGYEYNYVIKEVSLENEWKRLKRN